MLGVGAFPVQRDSAGADFSCAAVDGVEGVSRADGVHHCPIFIIVRVHRQDLQRNDTGISKCNVFSGPQLKLCVLIIVLTRGKKLGVGIGRHNILERERRRRSC